MIWRSPRYTGPERRRRPRRKIRPLRALVALLVVAAVCYGAAALWLMAQETKLVFEAIQTLGDARPPFPYEEIALRRPDGERQFAWLMRREGLRDGPWVVYLHGSPSTVASPVNIAHYRLLRDLGLNVIAPEYRGYGGLDGTPTESGLLIDARAAYDHLRAQLRVSPAAIVLYGWSLGAAVSIDLASRVDAGAVVLEGAPASIADLNQQRYPLFPVRLLMRNPFESLPKLARVSEPLLFLHSPEDEVVPIEHSRRLYEAATGPKTFVDVRGGHVEAIYLDEARLAGAIGAFLHDHGIAAAR